LELVRVAVYKVNISLEPQLVTQIDDAAGALGLSRSAFIAEASSRYLLDLKTLSAEEQRKRDIDLAIADMRERSKKIPPGVDYMKIIREGRERRRIW
jgi:metal-responsive CopG/Arc/MetJ family transcriptional regulator